MRRIIFILIVCLLVGIFASSCGDRCKETPFFPLLPQMEKYFKNYKLGSYWIYLNQDSTLQDSIYISDYKSVQKQWLMKGHCAQWEERTFVLHSEYLSTKKKLSVEYLNEESYCCKTFFRMNDVGKDYGYTWTDDTTVRTIEIRADQGVDSLIANTANFSIHRETNYQIWSQPQLIFPEVTKYKVKYQGELIFAPDFGLVQYTTNDNKHIFRLIKHHIE